MCPVNGIVNEPVIVTVKVCDEAKGGNLSFYTIRSELRCPKIKLYS